MDRHLRAGFGRIGVLWGLIPTAFFLIVTTALVTRGAPLPAAIGVGLAAWIARFVAARQLGLVDA